MIYKKIANIKAVLFCKNSDGFAVGENFCQTEHRSMKVLFKEKAPIFTFFNLLQISLAYRNLVNDELVAAEVIKPVAKQTNWVSLTVVISKQNGGFWLCVDLQKLNQCVQHLWYPSTTPSEAAPYVQCDEKLLTTFDASRENSLEPRKSKPQTDIIP